MFDDVKDAAAANSMQIAEVALHGEFTGHVCVPEPAGVLLLGFTLLALPVVRRRNS